MINANIIKIDVKKGQINFKYSDGGSRGVVLNDEEKAAFNALTVEGLKALDGLEFELTETPQTFHETAAFRGHEEYLTALEGEESGIII
ncbi:hypothetical protein [Methanococcus maripaludis]|jgi:hypothetical protein|uniref:Uncharacterized protein n=1 Tax=Methanococcus maripaludis TaxID=39152 RepID=A0A8T3W2F6_METMI|nr:hypothetical protein [Methanococcus maripaludis]MBG0769674.1 hypothetical protein [Methanococcus maripaludis]